MTSFTVNEILVLLDRLPRLNGEGIMFAFMANLDDFDNQNPLLFWHYNNLKSALNGTIDNHLHQLKIENIKDTVYRCGPYKNQIKNLESFQPSDFDFIEQFDNQLVDNENNTYYFINKKDAKRFRKEIQNRAYKILQKVLDKSPK